MMMINFSVQELEKNNAKVVVRCCEPSYKSEPLEEKGISVVVGICDTLQSILLAWFDMANFYYNCPPYLSLSFSEKNNNGIFYFCLLGSAVWRWGRAPGGDHETMAAAGEGHIWKGSRLFYSCALCRWIREVSIHTLYIECIHCPYLVRAPVLVAIALMEKGLAYYEAVDFIRRYLLVFFGHFFYLSFFSHQQQAKGSH